MAPTPTASTAAVDVAAAASTLADLQHALRRSDAAAVGALASDADARNRLDVVAANVERLRIADLTFRYLQETGEVAGEEWTAEVEVTWRIAGFDRASARGEVEIGFAGGGASIAGIGGGQRFSPLWLNGPLEVRRSADTLVLAERGVAADVLARQARKALVVVRRVLGDRARRLVVEGPSSAASLNAALGADPGTYDQIAGVTAGADGSNAPGAPVHVFINPDVYGDLEPLAAQVVMSHEAVHAVTEAPTSVQTAPSWLLEGFADYVALRDVELPLSTTAAQIIDQVRQRGVPSELPNRLDLSTGGPNLGAAYEAAWLVCVTLAERGGEEALVGFYDAVVAGGDLEVELRHRFGWTLADLTRAWQDRLDALAGGDG